jgi:two-component system, OmpR family, phosphate regulon sensor histidine kinase PhoR
MISRRSLSWPITLGVSMMVLLVALAVGWIIVTARSALEGENAALYWTLLAVGTTFLVLLLVGVVVYLLLSIKSVRLTQRQSNFIDSVTHELKSPIASLKLYLQTLTHRKVTPEQAEEFHRAMLEDLQRLDSLINHLLDAARIEREPSETPLEEVELSQLIRSIAHTACQHYRLADDAVELRLNPATLSGRPADLEMLFRNLIDNAIKYSGPQPKVEVDLSAHNGRVTTRISDNGPGIPINLRRKVFGRFVRVGSELERKQAGTGLGLFIVRQLVRRMRGKISVRGRPNQRGTVFEVELPRRVER